MQGKHPSVITEHKLSNATTAIARNDKSGTIGVKKTTNELNQRNQVENTLAKPFKFVKDEVKMEGWQQEQIVKAYESKILIYLLSIKPVFRALKTVLSMKFKVRY